MGKLVKNVNGGFPRERGAHRALRAGTLFHARMIPGYTSFVSWPAEPSG